MLLKRATSFFVVFGLILLLGFPWIVGVKPPGRGTALEQYSVRFGVFVIITTLLFVGAAFCALLLIRKTREEYRAASRQNLDDLVESALRTHQNRPPEAK